MDPQTKRTIFATVLCLGILVVWFKVQSTLYPPPPPEPVTTAPADGLPTTAVGQTGDSPTGGTQTPAMGPIAPREADSGQTAQLRAAGFFVPDAPTDETVVVGDDYQDNKRTGFTNAYELAATITPRGAGVESVNLSRHRDRVVKDKENPDHDPYPLLKPVGDPESGESFVSFVTETVRLLDEQGKPLVHLDDAIWAVDKPVAEGGKIREAVTLRAQIKKMDGPVETGVLEVAKTYRLAKHSDNLHITLAIKNVSNTPQKIVITERGPVGIRSEGQRDYRRVVAAVVDTQTGLVANNVESVQRDKVLKAEGAKYELLPEEGAKTIWAACGNKYFACIVAPCPLASDARYPAYLGKVSAEVLLMNQKEADDLTLEQVFTPNSPISPGDTLTLETDTYCGSKSGRAFDGLPDEVRARHYEYVANPDKSPCTFQFLASIMHWLLDHIYGVVHNYGIAIFILVIIVRLVLHAITKRGQVNMMKMQKGMAQLKPKIEAIQQQYKNDKQKLQEETMKIYREEGINPATQFLGCLPMALQMPVWVALYTTLYTNVDMRHQPFCLWMTDLSAPDALIPFSGEFHIPLIGMMMGPITAFNLLPIIMTITMYLQQKLTQKMTKPTTPVAPKTDKDGKPIPDQMAQQQKMMSFMMIFFGFIFYNFPSGLNLYILCSNLLGMIEQYRIKKEIREKEERGEFAVKKKERPGGKPTLFARYIDLMQKKAEQARLTQSGRPRNAPPRKDKKTKART
ncbi:MAG: YidC/Oxa1 family insertase periplasmic-domain containing protein [Phycisphaerae bacterium]|nr:YidC/Oxa1 family insertase periplasmic-domain containing protein [Phycisphaerae bacterium]